MKPRLAPILFAAVLVALVFVIFREKSGEGGGWWGRATERKQLGPDETVFAMVQAAQKGDTEQYIDFFWGPLRTRLEQTRDEMGRRRFAQYLKRTAGELTGVVTIGQPEPVGADLKVQAEMVYRDKNEVQELVLTRRRGQWRISAMQSARRIKTIIPYGTEAFPLTPPPGSETQEAEP